MQIIILCGGEGTRLKEETEFKPKPLVEVGGLPILLHIMEIYTAHGFNEFVLALGYKGEMIKDYFLKIKNNSADFTWDESSSHAVFHSGPHKNLKIVFADTGQKSLTGERIRQLAKYINGDDFMVTYGDGVADINIKQLLEFHKKQGTIGTITGVHPVTRFGLIEKDDATKKVKGFHQVSIVSLSRDPGKVQTTKHVVSQDYINGGFMVFKKQFLELLKPGSMIEEAFVPLIENEQLSVYEHEGHWKAMDTYKDMEELNIFWEQYPFWKPQKP